MIGFVSSSAFSARSVASKSTCNAKVAPAMAGAWGNYEARNIATPLPQDWTGVVPSYGKSDVPALTIEEALVVMSLPDDSQAAFNAYQKLVQAERLAALNKFKNQDNSTGPGGRKFVSNYNPALVTANKCVEYWRK
mmetsp:Transcript_20924/g.36012  ORF Transcript_20924/g.36012 Transcript_20924/m.36012 type:complete len:136 (+) Transcript_20924:93-500(+)|eukprot:CAMPEP_0184692878 /NCGR_PEP_ID=MMETSP0313-20130426/1200_1 /TAXON_ID=2792 /ORGANISM="Porphyridium aerugineum, Strain SAG 1380-2" /LENGTH=135 /DNA_ID=CAMNT_0027150775 /DNA_START=70 /DNA_END=477 /DNA_ORIENTATION=+